jgi:hypothetical protein
MSDYEVYNSCVRGHHVYKDLWTPVVGEGLICRAEFGNVHDPYAIAVQKLSLELTSAITVGHVPRNFSAVCHCFMGNGGTITCQVTGVRRYSADLIQGGLEVPCTYTFAGTSKYVDKVRRLLKSCPAVESAEQPSKKIKLEDPALEDSSDVISSDAADAVWIKFGGQFLMKSDEQLLIGCDWLNDRHINFAQRLFHSQFPGVMGLGHTLLATIKN